MVPEDVLRPGVVVFDVVETLMPLDPLRDRFAAVGLPPDLVPRWFDRLLRDGMALTSVGEYAPFPVVAAEALRTLARGRIEDEAVRSVLSAVAELPAHPEAAPAMDLLVRSGVSVVCLSNGPADTTATFLRRNDLTRYVDQVISVSEVEAWKPAPRVYQHALHRIGLPAAEVALVAVHAFDCHGAHGAGLTTGWARRLDGYYSAAFAGPDVVGGDLVDVVRQLLALPSASSMRC